MEGLAKNDASEDEIIAKVEALFAHMSAEAARRLIDTVEKQVNGVTVNPPSEKIKSGDKLGETEYGTNVLIKIDLMLEQIGEPFAEMVKTNKNFKELAELIKNRIIKLEQELAECGRGLVTKVKPDQADFQSEAKEKIDNQEQYYRSAAMSDYLNNESSNNGNTYSSPAVNNNSNSNNENTLQTPSNKSKASININSNNKIQMNIISSNDDIEDDLDDDYFSSMEEQIEEIRKEDDIFRTSKHYYMFTLEKKKILRNATAEYNKENRLYKEYITRKSIAENTTQEHTKKIQLLTNAATALTAYAHASSKICDKIVQAAEHSDPMKNKLSTALVQVTSSIAIDQPLNNNNLCGLYHIINKEYGQCNIFIMFDVIDNIFFSERQYNKDPEIISEKGLKFSAKLKRLNIDEKLFNKDLLMFIWEIKMLNNPEVKKEMFNYGDKLFNILYTKQDDTDITELTDDVGSTSGSIIASIATQETPFLKLFQYVALHTSRIHSHKQSSSSSNNSNKYEEKQRYNKYSNNKTPAGTEQANSAGELTQKQSTPINDKDYKIVTKQSNLQGEVTRQMNYGVLDYNKTKQKTSYQPYTATKSACEVCSTNNNNNKHPHEPRCFWMKPCELCHLYGHASRQCCHKKA